jgi:hypothetical protein
MIFGVLLIVGLSIGIGLMLSRRGPGSPRRSRHADPHDPMTALKASGALRHRKSNRP